MTTFHSAMRLYSNRSERLYLNPAERAQFRKQANREKGETRLLCLILFYTGCRISEALNLRWEDIQLSESIVAFRSLKKRDHHQTRELPIPPALSRVLRSELKQSRGGKLFFHDRTTGWRNIKRVMRKTQIVGLHCTPKGLRHSFGMWCAYNSIPITLTQRWMGHADLQTTAIYYQVAGKEEWEMAKRLWK